MVSSQRTRAFHHYDLSGEVSVELLEVLSEDVEEVSCRWCGTSKSVVEMPADATQ